jgi:hypothetical protein
MVKPTAMPKNRFQRNAKMEKSRVIYNRGNNGENLFREQRNYPYFLKLYAKHIEPIAETYAYCLLRNHFHLLVKIKDEKT